MSGARPSHRFRARSLFTARADGVLWGATLLASLYGCTSSDGAAAKGDAGFSKTACASAPLKCGAGETCWVKNCTCPSTVKTCSPSDCTDFDLSCLPSVASALLGQSCDNSLGKPTCGDGQSCVQVMHVNGGQGTCEAFCEPGRLGSCSPGYTCTAIGVALVASAPTIYVCQPEMDGGSLMVSDDSGGVSETSDASELPDAIRSRPPFDGGPLP